jgi:ribosome biogenesis GTPase / thiamine phosphate phosphatase
MRRRPRRASEAPVHSSSSGSGSRSSSSASSSSTSSSLDALGYRPTFAAALQMLGGDDATSALVPARVVAHLGERVRLAGATARHATLSGRLLHRAAAEDLPTVGDWVAIADAAHEDQLAVVHHVLPRHSAMIRRAAGRRGEGQAVAANVDTFVIVTSANRDANARRLERYLAVIWDSGARPIIAVNKAELCEPPRLAELLAEIEACAPHIGVHAVSAHTGQGIDELLAAAVGDARRLVPTLAFVGMSGVGKSSLVNRILGDLLGNAGDAAAQHTLPIDDHDRGRHATTRRELFPVELPAARFVVIDTPGMRSLGLVEDEGGLDASFAEIAAVAAGCRFSDCTHGDEPGCAVTEALARGEIDPERLASRHKLEREVRAAEVRRDPAQAANAKRRMKTIHVAQRARYKLDPKTRQ